MKDNSLEIKDFKKIIDDSLGTNSLKKILNVPEAFEAMSGLKAFRAFEYANSINSLDDTIKNSFLNAHNSWQKAMGGLNISKLDIVKNELNPSLKRMLLSPSRLGGARSQLLHSRSRGFGTSEDFTYLSSLAHPSTFPYYSSVQKALEYLEEKEFEENDYSFEEVNLLPQGLIFEEQKIILLDDVARIKNLIIDVNKNPEKIFNIKPREFEELMAELFRHNGFEVELTKETRDGGKDIIAIKSLNGFYNKYLVECRRFSTKRIIGIDVVDRLVRVVQKNNANKGIIATTSYFSRDVRKMPEVPTLISLLDNPDIFKWINDYITSKKS